MSLYCVVKITCNIFIRILFLELYCGKTTGSAVFKIVRISIPLFAIDLQLTIKIKFVSKLRHQACTDTLLLCWLFSCVGVAKRKL